MSTRLRDVSRVERLDHGEGSTTAWLLPIVSALSPHRSLLVWGGIAAASAALRLWMIDRVPLNTGEAEYAFAAWQAVLGHLSGSLVDLGAPFFSHAVALILLLFGASDIAARLIPALAGAGLALTPALLSAMVGFRTALVAGALIALSPIAIHLSRVVDPAETTALIVMVVVASAIRLLTDRPPWSLWMLAGGVGLGLASESAFIVALAAAGIAAVATWNPPLLWTGGTARRESGARSPDRRTPTIWRLPPYLRRPVPWGFGLGIAIVAATGGLMDLRGLGFILGDIWGGAAAVLTPVPFPAWNLLSVLAYSWPLLILAAAGFGWRTRGGDRLALFLGQWALLLMALAGAVGDNVLTLAVLPVAPLALLAAMAVVRLPWSIEAYRLGGSSWAMVALAAGFGVGAIVVLAHTLGAGRAPSIFALVALASMVAGVVALWRGSVPSGDRVPALVVLGALAYVIVTVGAISRLSFGGAPPGTELLVREQTQGAFRAAFRELNVLASADPRRILVIEMAPSVVARWYGRSIPGQIRDAALQPLPIVLRAAPAAGAGAPTGGVRTPWRAVSEFERADLHPLGIAQWMLSRTGLVKGRANDIIVAR
jgi:4-amino-4-deoxy-L-arabinose transferase-like glycosyltransferase